MSGTVVPALCRRVNPRPGRADVGRPPATLPDAIWHFYSTDGLTWGLYGRQPEIIRLEDEDNIKCLRSFLSPDGESIIGMLSVMVKRADDDGGAPWAVFWSRLPVGPPRME